MITQVRLPILVYRGEDLLKGGGSTATVDHADELVHMLATLRGKALVFGIDLGQQLVQLRDGRDLAMEAANDLDKCPHSPWVCHTRTYECPDIVQRVGITVGSDSVTKLTLQLRQ